MKRARNAMLATLTVVGLATAGAVGLAVVRADGEGGGHSHGTAGHDDGDVDEAGHGHGEAAAPENGSSEVDEAPHAEDDPGHHGQPAEQAVPTGDEAMPIGSDLPSNEGHRHPGRGEVAPVSDSEPEHPHPVQRGPAPAEGHAH